MKKGNSIWIVILSFLLGVLISYVSLQYHLFEIDLEINVVNTLISIGTAFIGVYIAVSIQKRLSQGQNNYLFIRDKFEKLWVNFNHFADDIKNSSNLPLSKLNGFVKNSYSQLDFINSIFKSFEINNKLVEELEAQIDNFEETLNTNINDNIIDLTEIKSQTILNIRTINNSFVKILKQISDL